MGKKTIETFSFSDLGQLRDWLNRFKATELNTVHFDNADYMHIDWVEEKLSDGSTVENARINMQSSEQ